MLSALSTRGYIVFIFICFFFFFCFSFPGYHDVACFVSSSYFLSKPLIWYLVIGTVNKRSQLYKLIHLRGGLLALSCSSPRSFAKASSADLEEGCAPRQLHRLFLFFLSQARLARHAKEMLCCLTSTTAASRTVIFLTPMYVLCIYCSFRPFSCNVCHINAFLIDFFSFVPSHCR